MDVIERAQRRVFNVGANRKLHSKAERELVAGFRALDRQHQAVKADRDKWRKLETEAANHVESLICLRTKFTGMEPYVGWKGLGLWLEWEFDRRDAALAVVEVARSYHPFCNKLNEILTAFDATQERGGG